MRTIDKDFMYYVKSITEVVMILLFIICLIVFIVSWIVFIWNKEVANIMMGWSMGIGFVNLLSTISWDSRWREDYEIPDN